VTRRVECERAALAALVGAEPAAGAGDFVERVLAAAREHLDMDVALLTEFVDDRQVYRLVSGDGASFGLEPGGGLALSKTYCNRMVHGDIPSLIPDARAEPRVSDLAVTRDQGIGAYVGVPLRTPDGRLHGVLCCLSHQADPSLGDRDVRFMEVLARLIGHHLAELQRHEERRRRHTRRVRRALAEAGLGIAFQPIVDLRSRRVVGVEALARFAAPPPRGPDRWFAEAAGVGLGVELELAAIRAAMAQLDLVPDGAYLSVNASPETLMDPRLGALLGPLPVHRVVVEVTEHARVEDYDRLAGAISGLRGGGLRLAVDDAGAGFASLRHIVQLAPDVIKLDISLTAGVDHHPGRRALAAALTAFAHQTGASLVAEGVESEAEVATLLSLGVDHGQGFHLARPGPLSPNGATPPG
jgi:EAL domain-containing protein (putative c-di-GMP-specific phosphodiesterase class I)